MRRPSARCNGIARHRRDTVDWNHPALCEELVGLRSLLTGSIAAAVIGTPLAAQGFSPSVGARHGERVDSLHLGERLARFDLLTPGTHRYLRYLIADGRRSPIDIWTRTVSVEEQDGTRRLRIEQRWDELGEPPLSLEQDAWFELGTFRPLTHIKTRRHGDTITVGGYRFLPDRIVGMDELPNNTRKGFFVASSEPAFDFEYDMELLQTLALRDGYRASVVFYDPALAPPARYTFVVAGSEAIEGPDGRPIDCWVVTADYNTGHVESRFWFAKRTQVLVREEGQTADGRILVKTLLNPEADVDELKP